MGGKLPSGPPHLSLVSCREAWRFAVTISRIPSTVVSRHFHDKNKKKSNCFFVFIFSIFFFVWSFQFSIFFFQIKFDHDTYLVLYQFNSILKSMLSSLDPLDFFFESVTTMWYGMFSSCVYWSIAFPFFVFCSVALTFVCVLCVWYLYYLVLLGSWSHRNVLACVFFYTFF